MWFPSRDAARALYYRTRTTASSMQEMHVAAFVVDHARHHPSALERPMTALPQTRSPKGTPTHSTLPDLGVSNTCPTRQAPGITPAAQVLPRLVVLSTQAFTSLDQFPYVRGSRPGIVSVSEPLKRFLGAESRSSPLPIRKGLSNAVWHRLRLCLPPRALRPFHG